MVRLAELALSSLALSLSLSVQHDLYLKASGHFAVPPLLGRDQSSPLCEPGSSSACRRQQESVDYAKYANCRGLCIKPKATCCLKALLLFCLFSTELRAEEEKVGEDESEEVELMNRQSREGKGNRTTGTGFLHAPASKLVGSKACPASRPSGRLAELRFRRHRRRRCLLELVDLDRSPELIGGH